MQSIDVTALIERFGSLGLIGWLVIWATTTAWPRISAHLDAVGTKLDRIGDQLHELHRELSETRTRLSLIDFPAGSTEARK